MQDLQVVGEGENGREALSWSEAQVPDVVLLDVELPLVRGDEDARIRRTILKFKVLAISSYDDRLYPGMLDNGASGHMLKEDT
jgi:DNA-binding NarL/FixJ family response regulator